MWTSNEPLKADVYPRPARLAYLVPKNPSHDLLDALIAECLSRWGGRRTPIIESNGQAIASADWALMDLWDADIIYSYVPLSNEIEARIYREFAPAELKIHRGPDDSEDSFGNRPDYSGNFNFLSSLSLLPFFARRAHQTGTPLPEVIDTIHYAVGERDLRDTFGFVTGSFIGHSLLPYARRICLSPETGIDPVSRPAKAKDISYFEDAEELVARVAKRRSILSLSRLADMLCPYLNHLALGKDEWSDHLTIVIGDTPADRLLFWNAQHRYPSIGGRDDLPVLRFSPKRFENGPPDWLKEWVSLRNHRHLPGNQAPRTVLRSCSLEKERLDEIAKSLASDQMVMVSGERHSTPCLFDSCEDWRSANRKGSITAMFPSIWVKPPVNNGTQIRFVGNQIEVPLASPWHIQNFAESPRSWGIWATDLTIERAENHSPYSNRHHIWKFPRRFRMDTVVQLENYFVNQRLVLPPPPRPTETGKLTIWDGTELTRPVLTLPSDYHAFVNSIEMISSGSPEALKLFENNENNKRFERVSISDKGRDLLGVFQFFRSLPEALRYLTDSFWLNVISELSPEEPESKDRNVSKITERLNATLKNGLKEPKDLESIAKRALQLAGRSFLAQSQQLKSTDFEKLYAWSGIDQIKKNKTDNKERLEKSLTYLRDRGFFWQGFKWVCSFCQHHNWISLERLEAIAECEICRKPKSSPVSRGLEFRLNPFVQHAFSSTSAQGSVIWCIDQLAQRAHWSFAFAPTLDIYDRKSGHLKSDLDLAANVDGKIYLAEVKTSFSNLKQRDLNQLNEFANELRPDVVMLAIATKSDIGREHTEMIQNFKNEFQVDGVQFEVLLPGDTHSSVEDFDVASPFGKEMKWSAW